MIFSQEFSSFKKLLRFCLEECYTWASWAYKKLLSNILWILYFKLNTKSSEDFRNQCLNSLFSCTAIYSYLESPVLNFLFYKAITSLIFFSFKEHTYISHNKCWDTNVMDAYPWRLLENEQFHLFLKKEACVLQEERIPAMNCMSFLKNGIVINDFFHSVYTLFQKKLFTQK